MKLILQQDVANLGNVGDVVNVAPGYGRNFLIPRGLAVLADEGNVRRLEHQKRVVAHKRAKLLASAQALATQLSNTAVSIKRQAGEEGKLFGSVTNRDIAEALAAEGIEVDRRSIRLEEPIRTVGVFHVPVRLEMGVEAEVKAYVIQE
ncbi:MAG: 50S ribosomal protein L9 [Alphaproteobacteria bacterium]|nr:50S ribosomal protein L9 [Alphaproteobacteria bacterium]MCB9791837.1 50S ribosomal protein L9 [Alphaproteobacteria bacterium]